MYYINISIMRSKITLIILLCVVCTSIASSQEQEKDISHYIFPAFTKGKILLKTGIARDAMLNYNSITEEMVFESNGTKLAIANPGSVDTIFILEKKFITAGKTYYEVLGNYRIPLLVRHLCTVLAPGKESGYGGTSQTTSITSVSTIFAAGQAYELKLPDGYSVLPYLEYVVKKDNEYKRITNVSQVIKCFPEKENEIKAFVKTNKTSFKKEEDINKLIEICNK
jgi:hypothetical protein